MPPNEMSRNATTGIIELELCDVRGNPLRTRVTLELRQYGGSARFLNHVESDGKVRVRGLPVESRRTYQVEVAPENFLRAAAFVNVPANGEPGRHRFRFPVRPSAVAGIQAPPWDDLRPGWQRVLLNAAFGLCPFGVIGDAQGDIAGPALWDGMSAERKACFLNLLTKAAATPVGSGDRNCDDFLGGLMCLERDRIYTTARAGFYEEVKHTTRVFYAVPSTLHRVPEGYHVVESFKTEDRYGNLQLTFFRKGETGDEYAVDMDIDEASGLAHVFEVARNELLEVQTNPYMVREILIAHQGLDPGYDFLFAEPAPAIEVG